MLKKSDKVASLNINQSRPSTKDHCAPVDSNLQPLWTAGHRGGDCRLFVKMEDGEELGCVQEDRVTIRIYVFDGDELVLDEEQLLPYSLQFAQVAESMTEGYIWQHDSLSLHILSESGIACVGCTLRYGDNVEDEWLSVRVVHEITHKFTETVATVEDEDGQFLLIEAANFLPSWLEPETSDNRVFIAGGKLQILPKVSAVPDCPLLQDALKIVRASVLGSPKCIPTCADDGIQACISARLSGLPQSTLSEGTHVTKCHIPLSVAQLLRRNPQILSPAVRTFYNRDPSDLNAASAMQRFGGGAWVDAKVRFSKCLYAQLMKQPFFAPKSVKLPGEDDPDFKCRERGMKVACAFEMLYKRDPDSEAEPACFKNAIASRSLGDSSLSSEGGPLFGCTAPTETSESPWREVEGWGRFEASLKKRGYFRGEMEGSKLYRKLRDKAVAFFDQTRGSANSKRAGLAALMDATLRDEEEQSARGSQQESSKLQPKFWDPETDQEDDDTWLDMSPDDLERLLKGLEGIRGEVEEAGTDGGGDVGGGGDGVREGGEVLEKMVKSMSSFVDKVSSFQGAEIPQHTSAVHAQTRQHAHARSGREEERCEDVSLDCQLFVRMMREGLGLVPGDVEVEGGFGDDEDEDEDEDWEEGKQDGQGDEGPSLQDLMEAMDREIALGPLGSTFRRDGYESEVTGSAGSAHGVSKHGDHGHDAHDRLPRVNEDDDYVTKHRQHRGSAATDEEDDKALQPISIDLNLVENMLASYKAQAGLSGPASNLYGLLGVSMPDDTNDTHLT